MDLARVHTEAITRRQHNELANQRRRPLTDDPIQRKKNIDPAWIADTPETILGFTIKKAPK